MSLFHVIKVALERQYDIQFQISFGEKHWQSAFNLEEEN